MPEYCEIGKTLEACGKFPTWLSSHPGSFNTWNQKPTFHYSSSRREKENPQAKKEAHSNWEHEKINSYGKAIDIMLETKMKELLLVKYRSSIEADEKFQQKPKK